MRNVLVMLTVSLAVACGPQAGSDISAAAGDPTSGATLYAANCTGCH